MGGFLFRQNILLNSFYYFDQYLHLSVPLIRSHATCRCYCISNRATLCHCCNLCFGGPWVKFLRWLLSTFCCYFNTVRTCYYRIISLLYFTVLYCTLLYCTVLYCTALYCTVLYCTVLYCTVLYYAVLYCTVLYCTVLYCTVLCCTVLYCTVLYCTICTNRLLRCDVLEMLHSLITHLIS